MARALFRNSLRIADQGGQAIGNMIVTVVLARILSIESFAAIATALTIWLFFSVLQRNGIVALYLADVPYPHDDAASENTWFAVNVISFLACGIVLVSFGALLPGLLGEGMTLASLLVPFAGLHFFNWRVLYHRGRIIAASMISLLSIGLLLASAAILYLGLVPANTSMAAAVYIVAYAGSAFCGLFLVSPSMPTLESIRAFYDEKRGLIGVMSLGSVFAFLYNNGIQIFLAGFAHAAEVAAFSATRVFVGPLNMIAVAIADNERSNASRQYHLVGDEGLLRTTKHALLIIGGIVLPLALVLLWFAPELLKLLYGSKYNEFDVTARLWILALAPQILALPFDIQQSVRQQGKELLWARAAGAFAAVLALFVGFLLIGELQAWGGVLSVGVGRLVSLLVMYANSRRPTDRLGRVDKSFKP